MKFASQNTLKYQSDVGNVPLSIIHSEDIIVVETLASFLIYIQVQGRQQGRANANGSVR